MMPKTFLITGGAGFIGSAVARELIHNTEHRVVIVDNLTYAGNLASLQSIANSTRYTFTRVDICDNQAMDKVFYEHNPDIVLHLAAESHVDRSIDSPAAFIQTNIIGTHILLEVARHYWAQLCKHKPVKAAGFRFHHVSTDEVYGDLDGTKNRFTETTAYAPSSPYAATKASSDHLVRAWHRTFGLPTLVTNCSNNYGPYHFPEKLIPLMILSALAGKPLPVYGDGKQIRDWLYVEDHARALIVVALQGKTGTTYNIGGNNEKQNIEVVHTLCDILQVLQPTKSSYHELIRYVKDRPGHDVRYAIDASKIKNELGWVPLETFESGLRKTVEWYLNNTDWWQRVVDGSYQGQRLGLTA